VYVLNGSERLADVGRTLEATVFKKDAEYPPDFIEQNFNPYDNNSLFFILLDENNPVSTRAAGVLRIIVMKDGKSETVSMFKEFFGQDRALPPELTQEEGEEVWDILTVAMLPEYRNGINSAWLYRALYKKSQEQGIKKGIANITPHEMRNLRKYIGMPFREIPNVPEVIDRSPTTGKESAYGFYTVNVDEIYPSIASNIKTLENQLNKTREESERNFVQLLIKVARIVIDGSTREIRAPNNDQNPVP
jgi:hypothetical protein